MDSTVVIEPAYNALSDVRALFEAYTAMLVTHDPAFQIYLDIQHYADELRAPAAKRGGTAYTVRRAKKEGLEVIHLIPVEVEQLTLL